MPSKLTIDRAACTGCGCCVISCPVEAIASSAWFVAGIDETICTDCLECLGYCPTQAIRER